MSGGMENEREEREEHGGGYAPLINHKAKIQHKFPEHVLDAALKETGLDKFKDGGVLPTFKDYLELELPKEITDKFKASNKQVGGNHYKDLKIQPMEFCMANGLDFATSNAIKYLVRRKGDSAKRAEDLRKSIHCIQLLAEHEGLVL